MIDQYYDVNFIRYFEPIDDIIKRLSVALVATSIIMLYATVVSSYIAQITIKTKDYIMRNFELHLYFSIIALNTSLVLLILGVEVEKITESSGTDPNPVPLPPWPEGVKDAFETLSLISLIWVIAASLFLFSRSAELRAARFIAQWLTVSKRPTSPTK